MLAGSSTTLKSVISTCPIVDQQQMTMCTSTMRYNLLNI